MKLTHLKEPPLEFGGAFRHTDIRFGIMDYGPFDLGMEGAPKRIRLGIVGSADTVEVPPAGSRHAGPDSRRRKAANRTYSRRFRASATRLRSDANLSRPTSCNACCRRAKLPA